MSVNKATDLLNKKWFPIALLVILPLLIYSNSFNNSFHYDDNWAFVKNDTLKDFKNIPGLFTRVFTGKAEVSDTGYRPLLDASFALNYAIGGLNPVGYHIVNLLFHVLNGILIYLIVSAMMGGTGSNRFVPLVSAVLFIAHPIHSETVNYIHARSSILATFFILLSIYLYIRVSSAGKLQYVYYAGMVLSFVAGVFTKELAFTFPIVLVLYDYFFISGGNKTAFKKNLLKYHLLFFILIGFYLVSRVFLIKNLEAADDTKTPLVYLMTQTRVIMNYIRLLLYPVNLAVERHVPLSRSFLELKVMLSTTLIAAMVFAAFRLSRKSKLMSFSISWFFITLLPTTSVVPLIIMMNEHRLYLPGIGFSILSAVLLWKLYNAPVLAIGIYRKTLNILLSAILVLFCVRVYARNRDWKNEHTLWSKNVKICPDSFRAHNNLGAYYDRENDYDNAMKHYEASLKLNPEVEGTQNNLGIIYYKKGFYDKAVICYQNAIALREDHVDAHNNLGIVYARQDLMEESKKEFNRVIEINPEHKEVYKNLGLVYKMMHNKRQALDNWEKYLEVNPDAPDAQSVRNEISRLRNKM